MFDDKWHDMFVSSMPVGTGGKENGSDLSC